MKVALMVFIYVVASILYVFCNVRYVNRDSINLSEVMFWSDYYTAVQVYAMFLVALPYLIKRKLSENEMGFIYFILIFKAFNILVYIGDRIISKNPTTTPYFYLFMILGASFCSYVLINWKHGKA